MANICLWTSRAFLFESRIFAKGSCCENKISMTIVLIRLAAWLVALKNSVCGFCGILISIFSYVIKSFSSDTIAFLFKRVMAAAGGRDCRNWAKRNQMVFKNVLSNEASLFYRVTDFI